MEKGRPTMTSHSSSSVWLEGNSPRIDLTFRLDLRMIAVMRLGTLTVHFAGEDQADVLRGDSSMRIAEVGAAIRSQEDLFRELARVLEFPDYFGHNWDAVSDCLSDLDTEQPVVLLMHNGTALWSRMADDMATLVEIWIDVSASLGGDLHLVFVR
jgi:RNAse (barnase) inhibitor barstar